MNDLPLDTVWKMIRKEAQKQFWIHFELLGYETPPQANKAKAIDEMTEADYRVCMDAMLAESKSFFDKWDVKNHPELQFAEPSALTADCPF